MEEELLKKVKRRRIRLVVVLVVVALFAGSTIWAMYGKAARDNDAVTEPVTEQEVSDVELAADQEGVSQTADAATGDATEKSKEKAENSKQSKQDKKAIAAATDNPEEKAVKEAAEVDQMIQAIGVVEPNKKTKKKIKAARKGYDALSQEAKGKVKNLENLEVAEVQYRDLKAQQKAEKQAAKEQAAKEKAAKAGKTVTISISCKELADNMDRLQDGGLAKYVPDNGTILGKTKYTFTGKVTVYDVLKKACRDYGIHYIQETGSGYSGVYISSINHLAEFDGGKNSGWMYEVNGTMPNITCSQYVLKNGDKIKWFYTINYKKE